MAYLPLSPWNSVTFVTKPSRLGTPTQAESIYKLQLEKHLSEGTMPAGATKEALILSYEHDPSRPLPP